MKPSRSTTYLRIPERRIALILLVVGIGAIRGFGDDAAPPVINPHLTAGRAAMEDGNFRQATTQFEEALGAAASRMEREEIALLLIQALHAQGDYQQIVDWLKENRRLISRAEVESAFAYWHALALYELERYEAALDELKNFEQTYLGQAYVASAIRLRGLAREHLRHFKAAEEAFRMLDRLYPDHEDAPQAMLDWARVMDRQSKSAEATAKLEELVRRYPETEAAGRARLSLAQRYLASEDQADKAVAMLQGVMAQGAALPAPVLAEALVLQAELHWTAGERVLAIETLRRAEALTGEVDRTLAIQDRLMQWLVQADQVADALALVDAAVREAPGAPGTGDLQYGLGALLLDHRYYADALDAFQRYIETYADSPRDLDAHMGKGWALFQLGRYAEAATSFDRVALQAADPVLRDLALLRHGDALFMNRQFRTSVTAYERALAEGTAPETIRRARMQIAEALARVGDHAEAEAMLRGVIEADPVGEDAQRALIRIAELRERNRDWEGALAVFDEFLVAFSGAELEPNARMGRGMLLYRLGRFEDAGAMFDRLLADDPDTSWAEEAMFMQARTLYRQGDVRPALSLARAFLDEHPGSEWVPEVKFWLAQHAFNAGDYADAETALVELATEQGDTAWAVEAWYWAGQAATQQRRYDAAMGHFNQVVRLAPAGSRVPEARFAQGDALTELSEFAGAILAFEEVIRSSTNTALAVRAMVRKGDCLFSLGTERPDRYEEAIATYRQAVEDPAASPALQMEVQVKIGRTFEKMGREQDAFDTYAAVVYEWLAEREAGVALSDTWFVRAAFHAAALREKQEAWEDAASLYERVVASGVPAAADAALRIERIRDRGQTP